jgi:hypothetical protein
MGEQHVREGVGRKRDKFLTRKKWKPPSKKEEKPQQA